ncbi:MAG TPA: hypothetical protein VHC23_13480, partial [Jatrophihabitans sp.]|nr:hypothetical protein [Jatrophihabitans sp.]
LRALDTHVVQVVAPGEAAAAGLATVVEDVDGTYQEWLAGDGVEIVLTRPDNYVFAALPDAGQLPDAVAQLVAKLGLRTSAPVG